MIKLSEKAERHLSLHFGNSNSAGSVFFTEVFANPSELLNYVNSCEPSATIAQAGNREALIFHMAEPVGNTGIIQRIHVKKEDIVLESRNGFQVEVALLNQLEVTYEFCVILERGTEGVSIITAFPGGYSLPFPYEGQDQIEFEKSTMYWQEYVLCRKK